jgi:LemA protein
VRGYAGHERTVLESLVLAREEATAHRDDAPEVRVGFESSVARALSQVLVRAEAYPELQASRGFLDLQHELTLAEDRIAASRRFYNGNVRAFNTRVRTFPSNLVAAIFQFYPRDFFELDDPAAASAPRVGP